MADQSEPASKEPVLVKVTVAKGRTFKLADYESLRLDYAVEDTVPRERAVDVFRMWEANIDRLLAEHAASAPVPPAKPSATPPAPAPTQTPQPSTPATTPPSSNTDPYANLAWRQSEKKPALSTIRVDEKLLTDPNARALYETVKPLGKQGIRICGVNYKLSITANGTEFLQRWASSPPGDA